MDNDLLGERTMLKAARTVCAVGAMALTLTIAACGDDADDPTADTAGSGAPATTASGTPPGDGSALKIAAEDKAGLKFDKSELTASAGEVTITMDNPDGNGMPHDVAIEGDGVDATGEVVQPGGTSEVSADLKAGTYTFYCSVGQHRQAGMEGTLTVQ
jgi:plastocyanin